MTLVFNSYITPAMLYGSEILLTASENLLHGERANTIENVLPNPNKKKLREAKLCYKFQSRYWGLF